MQVDEALGPGQCLPDQRRLFAQHRDVRAEDAHDDRLAGASQDLLDALPEIGLDVAIDPG